MDHVYEQWLTDDTSGIRNFLGHSFRQSEKPFDLSPNSMDMPFGIGLDFLY